MITTKRMDPDGEKQTKLLETEKEPDGFLQRNVTNAGNVFPAVWLRRFIQVGDGNNGVVLGCRYSFLWNFRIFLVILYIAVQILK